MPDPVERGCWGGLISTDSKAGQDGGPAWSYQGSLAGRKTLYREEYEEEDEAEGGEAFGGASLWQRTMFG